MTADHHEPVRGHSTSPTGPSPPGAPESGEERLSGLAFRRNRQHRWEGWCIWATPGIPAHGGEPHVQLGWVDAERIQRVE